MQTFDAIIVGAGQAGPPLAARLTGAGMTVALVEREHVGGTCVNVGCTPTKTLVASARVAHVTRRAADYGVVLQTDPVVDMVRVRDRAIGVAADSRAKLQAWLDEMQGLTLIRGHARFTGPDRLQVGEKEIGAARIFLNVGARPAQPDLPGTQDVPTLTSTTILDLEHVPAHLAVIGGSYIGLEFAQMYRRFGAQVTVIERGDRLIAREDPEISEAIRAILEAEGIQVRTGADCVGFARHPDGISVNVTCAADAPDVVATDVLMAVGRTPNTDDLDLQAAGITSDEQGYVTVNYRLETATPGIWALGDCNGHGAFTHTAVNDYEIVAANLLDGADRKVSDRIPAYALYIDPPLGRVGLSEAQAREAKHTVLTVSRPMTRVGRAVERGETQGLMKAVVDATTGRILGAAILGIEGDEAIHGILNMMHAGAGYRTLQWAVPIHPTVSELIPTLMGDLKPE